MTGKTDLTGTDKTGLTGNGKTDLTAKTCITIDLTADNEWEVKTFARRQTMGPNLYF
jgi:hypothetical protein